MTTKWKCVPTCKQWRQSEQGVHRQHHSSHMHATFLDTCNSRYFCRKCPWCFIAVFRVATGQWYSGQVRALGYLMSLNACCEGRGSSPTGARMRAARPLTSLLRSWRPPKRKGAAWADSWPWCWVLPLLHHVTHLPFPTWSARLAFACPRLHDASNDLQRLCSWPHVCLPERPWSEVGH